MRTKTMLFVSLLVAAGCQDESLTPHYNGMEQMTISSELFPDLECDLDATAVIWVDNTKPIAFAPLHVDAENFYVSYSFNHDDWFLVSDSAWVGDCSISPEGFEFQHHETFLVADRIRSHAFYLPFANEGILGCAELRTEFGRIDALTGELVIFRWQYSFVYSKCESTDDENLRTEAQGAWGSPAQGDNAAGYLHKNFSSAFPTGLTIGCNFSVKLSSAQAVTDFLPSGGRPAALTKNYINPKSKPRADNVLKNVLAGQIVALKLSMRFDEWDGDFGTSKTRLANAKVARGTFIGWTVKSVLAEAEQVLGGCSSQYKPSELSDIVTAINENYSGGNMNQGLLINGI